MLEIHNVIAHELIKEADTREYSISLNPNGTFDKTSPTVHGFISTTDKAYSKRPKALGKFRKQVDEYRFQLELKKYLSQTPYEQETFIEFTTRAMSILGSQASIQPKSTGGIVIFIHESNRLMVFLLSKKTAYNISDFSLKDLEILDNETLRFATSIELDKAYEQAKADSSEECEPYISFIRGTASKVSNYFQDFIGCENYSSPKESTKNMIEAVRTYMTELNYDTAKRREIEAQILSYCNGQKNNKEHTYLSAISSIVNNEDANGLIEFISTKKIKCPDIFETENSVLKTLKRYEYKTAKWSLSFDHTTYENETIQYIADENVIIIKDVPVDFKKKLDI